MQSLEEIVNRCLVAIADREGKHDEQSAWLASLEALASNIDFTQSQLRSVKAILAKRLPSDVRIALTRVLVFDHEDPGNSELFDSYLQALAEVSPQLRIDEGGVLGAFFRGSVNLVKRWHTCVEVLGIDTAVDLLTPGFDVGFPSEVLPLFTESNRAKYRADVIWDFVMVASPHAWRHAHARRPDFRARYWYSLLDWPYGGPEQNSTSLVARNILSAREAEIFEKFGARLREHTSKLSDSSDATLVACPILHAIGEKALMEFFGPDFQTALMSIYSGP